MAQAAQGMIRMRLSIAFPSRRRAAPSQGVERATAEAPVADRDGSLVADRDGAVVADRDGSLVADRAAPWAPAVVAAASRARVPPALASYLGLVLLPALVVAGFYHVVAADQYASTARFAVREAQDRALYAPPEADAEDGPAASPPAVEVVSQLTVVAAAYLRSRAMVEALIAEGDLLGRYRRREADPLFRLADDASIEDVVDYWRARTDVVVDGPSQVVTFRVRAFHPEDARLLAAQALAEVEALTNRLSERRKQDALARAQAGVAEAETRLRAALAALAAQRAADGLVDPAGEASRRLDLLGGLMAERIEIGGRIAGLRGLVADDAPQMADLRGRLTRIDADIAALRAELAGGEGGESMAAALARFEAAEVRLRFAERLYDMAQTMLVGARIDLARQSIYVQVFDPPALAGEARHPDRVVSSLFAFLALSAVWSIAALIVASVRDHRIAS